MKKIVSLLLILLALLLVVACKEKKESEKKEVKKVLTEKPAKKKVPKTDPLKIVEQAASGTTAKSVVANYFEVIGGIDRAKKVKTILQKSLIVDNPDDTYELTTKYMLPNKMYEQTALKGEVFTKNAFNGKTGYDEYEGERKTYTAEEVKEFRSSTRLIFPDFDYAKGTLKGIAEVKGEKCYVIEYKNEKIYYSVATGLRVVIIEIAKDDEGKEKIVANKYTSNYKDVEGLKFPFTIKETRPNMRSAKFDVQEILVNKGVSNKDFE